VNGSFSTPYIEATEKALETSCQTLEIMSATYVEPPRVNPHFSYKTLMMARTILK